MKYVIKEFDVRYFLGVELEGGIKPGETPNIGVLWNSFLNEDIKLLQDVELLEKFIGLECYPPDFKESHVFDYYAMVQTKEKMIVDGFTTKKLPAGRYIHFDVEFDDLMNEIQACYQFVKEEKIDVHYGFDYEDYREDQDYQKEGARLNFCLKLEND